MARSRSLTATATVNRNIITVSTTPVYSMSSASIVSGVIGASISGDFTTVREQRIVGMSTEYRWVFSGSFVLTGFTDNSLDIGVVHTTVWQSLPNIDFQAGLTATDTATYTLTQTLEETTSLTEIIKSKVLSVSCSSIMNGGYRFYSVSPFGAYTPFTLNFAGSYEESFPDTNAAASYSYTISGLHTVTPEPATTGRITAGLSFTGVSVGGSCSVACDGLDYSGVSASATDGPVSITGDSSSITVQLTKLPIPCLYSPSKYFVGGVSYANIGNNNQASASITVYPKWELDVTSQMKYYKDYSDISELKTARWSGVQGAENTLDKIFSGTDNMSGQKYSIGIGDGTNLRIRNFGGSIIGTITNSVYDEGNLDDATTFHGTDPHGNIDVDDPLPMNNATKSLRYEVDCASADDYGTYLTSENFWPWDLGMSALRGPVTNGGTISFATSHQFKIFDSAANFIVQRGSPSIVSDADGIRVVSPNQNTRVDTTNKYLFKPFGYRYYRLRAKADKADSKFKFYITIGSSMYAWNFIIPEADIYKTFNIDLGKPDYISQVAGPIDNDWNYYTSILHPRQNASNTSYVAGIECKNTTLTNYVFDSLEGYYKPEPGDDTDRTPILLIGGMECVGDQATSLTDYETLVTRSQPPGAPDTITYYAARLVVNGLNTINFIHLISSPSIFDSSFYTNWNTYKNNLNTGTTFGGFLIDTGITITADNNYETQNTKFSHWKMEKPYRDLTPGTPYTIQVQRKGTGIDGYYGMGDLFSGTYGSTITIRLVRMFGGEIIGNIHRGKKSRKDIEVKLLDNDTKTIRDTAISDADGLYRLFYKYGVLRPHKNYKRGDTKTTRLVNSGGVPTNAQGWKMNSYWIQGADLKMQKDDEDILTTLGIKTDYIILDRFSSWYDLQGLKIITKQIDSKRFPDGRVYTVYSKDGKIKLVKQDDMNVMNEEELTDGVNPAVEFTSSGSLLFFVNLDGQLEMKTSTNEYGTLT